MKHRRDFRVPGLGTVRMRPVVKSEFYIEGGGGEKMGDETTNAENNGQRDKGNSDIKVCPILTLAFSFGRKRIVEVGCLKDSCAWFEDRYNQCAILIIARELFDI